MRDTTHTADDRSDSPHARLCRHEAPRSEARRGREVILKAHRCVALSVGAIIMVLSLSGSLLVFRDELSAYEALSVEPGPPQPRSLQTLVETVAAMQPGGQVERLVFSEQHGSPLEIFGRKSNSSLFAVAVDPSSGALLGLRGASVFDRLRELHNLLFLDSAVGADVSRYVVGIIGILTMLLSLSGIFLWWPRGENARRAAFRINFNASWKRTNWDLHRVGGVASAALILVVSGSGAFVAFAEAAGQNAGPPPAIVSTTPTKARPLSADELLERAQGALPGARVTELHLTSPGAAAVVALLEERDERGEPMATPRVWLDRGSGAVLGVTGTAAQSGALGALERAMKSVHRGQILGAPGRLLVFATGLAPLFLGVSGLLIWWSKQKKRRRLGTRRRAPTLSWEDIRQGRHKRHGQDVRQLP